MERCVYCKMEDTALYESGVPICLKCVARREAKSNKDRSASVHDILVGDLKEARLQAESAATEFNAVTSDIPSFIPPPDGAQRIHNASQKLTEARNAMMKAHRRLNDYLERGIVPEDLKRTR
jgi:hypothetical protein